MHQRTLWFQIIPITTCSWVYIRHVYIPTHIWFYRNTFHDWLIKQFLPQRRPVYTYFALVECIRSCVATCCFQMHVLNTTSLDVRTIQDYRFVYGLSISILIFCACMCLSVALVWAFAEVCLWPQERFLQRHQILELTRFADERDATVAPAEFV